MKTGALCLDDRNRQASVAREEPNELARVFINGDGAVTHNTTTDDTTTPIVTRLRR
jgi:hypothetical protein